MDRQVRIVCFTNLDGYEREVWPCALQVRPMDGDRVYAESGRNLRVVALSHLFDGTLRVELHK